MSITSRPQLRTDATVRVGCTALALIAGSISVAVAALSGWRNGVAIEERALWAMAGVVAVLAAHLLPAVSRHSRGGVYAMALTMWATCMAYAIYGHATYFSLIQQEAGIRRAEHLPVEAAELRPQRALSVVLTERAELQAQLTKLLSSTCPECPKVQGRIAETTARMTALHAEADEIKDDRNRRDRADRLRDQQRANPVISSLAAWMGLTPDRLALAPALAFAVILDGLASLCWLLLAQSTSRSADLRTSSQAAITSDSSAAASVAVTRVEVMPVQVSPPTVAPTAPEPDAAGRLPAAVEQVPTTNTQIATRRRDFDALVRAAETARAAGHIRKMTVSEVRAYLGCQQKVAAAVVRTIKNHTQGTLGKPSVL
jgi:hypothetical protein